MTAGRWPNRSVRFERRMATARRVGLWLRLMISMVSGLALLLPWLPPQTAVAQTAGVASAGEGAVLTLTEALAMALEGGPGFAALALQERLRELTALAAEAPGGPVVDVSVRTALSDLSPVVQGTLSWPLADGLSLQLNVNGTAEPGGTLVPVGTPAGGTLALRFERTLWPPADGEREREMETLEQRAVDVQGRQAALDALREVVEAFYTLRDATLAAEAAEQALELAVQRAAVAQERFAAGLIGVSELQAAQQREREALVALRSSRQARADASMRLARLLAGGDGATDWLAPGADAGQPQVDSLAERLLTVALVDDYPWADWIVAVEQVLDESGETWHRIVLDNDVAFLGARRSELEQEAALAQASAGPIRWRLSAQYTALLPGGTGSGPQVSGEARAVVAGTLDLSGAARLRAEQAAVQLELARLRTEQARQAALDGAEAARRALEDAEFARELARVALEQAEGNLQLVLRRLELGFASALERLEAEQELARARRELLRAEANLHLRWLEMARRLGVTLP